MKKSYLLLGTNLGDRKQNIESAVAILTSKDLYIRKQSNLYESAAWGYTHQPSFFNLALEIDTAYSPEELLNVLKSIEQEMGREKREKWQERLIDIDILYYDNEVISTPDLCIPHPEIQNRKFALLPLKDIAPKLLHPVLNKTTEYLLLHCEDPLDVKVVR